MVGSFVGLLDVLPTQSKYQTNLNFLQIETNVKSKLNILLFTHNQSRCRKEPVLECKLECVEEEDQDASTLFLQTQGNQFPDLQVHFKENAALLLYLPSTAQNTISCDNRLIAASLASRTRLSHEYWSCLLKNV